LLYLSDLYQKCRGNAQKEALLKTSLKTSTHGWGHVNMVGEYNLLEQESYQKLDKVTIMKPFDDA
jgi:cytochrome c551/c552